MSATSTLARPLLGMPEPERPPRVGLVLVAAAVRAAVIAVSGLVLVVGMSLLVWAVTPATGSNPTAVVRGGIGAFAAAHLLPVSIGTATLTLPPLLLTVLFGGFLAAGVARGRYVAEGVGTEFACAVLGAASYAGVVLAAVHVGAPAGAVDLRDWWRTGAFALVAAVLGTAVRGTAWRAWWAGRSPRWLQVGVRTGVAGAMLLVAGGALGLAAALVRSFTTAAAVGELAAPTAGDAFGMAVLGLLYLPTAVLVGVGYLTGVGFQIGAGSYSPLGNHGVDLPAVPLLAAVPPTGGIHPLGLLVFGVPVIAAVVVGLAVVRRVDTRSSRLLAAGVAGVVASGVLTAALAVAGGGIGGSALAHIGVPLGWFAVAVAAEVGLPAMAWAGVAGLTRVPWRVPGPADDEFDSADDAVERADDEASQAPEPATLVWDVTEGLPEGDTAQAEPDGTGVPGQVEESAETADLAQVDESDEIADLERTVESDETAEIEGDESEDAPTRVVVTGLAGDVVDGAEPIGGAAADAAESIGVVAEADVEPEAIPDSDPRAATDADAPAGRPEPDASADPGDPGASGTDPVGAADADADADFVEISAAPAKRGFRLFGRRRH